MNFVKSQRAIFFSVTNLNTGFKKKVVLEFCLPQAIQVHSINDLIGRRLLQSLAHWASKSEKLVAQKENLPVPDDWTALF